MTSCLEGYTCPCSLIAEKREESRIVAWFLPRIMCFSIAFYRCAKLRHYNCVVDDSAEAIRRWFLPVGSRVQFWWTLHEIPCRWNNARTIFFFFSHLIVAAYCALSDTTTWRYGPAAVYRFIRTMFVEIQIITVELGYNDLCLCDSLSIILCVLWYQLFPIRRLFFCVASRPFQYKFPRSRLFWE